MSIAKTTNRVFGAGIRPVTIAGAFRPNGVTGVVSGSTKNGNFYSVARVAVGVYRVTFRHPLKRVVNVLAGIRTALGNLTHVACGPYNATNKTLDIYVNRQVGFIDLPITNARALTANDAQAVAADGGVLCLDTASGPILHVLTAAKEFCLEWAIANVNEIMWAVSLPPDFDETIAATFYAQALCADLNTLTVQAFFGINGTDAGGATGALAAAIGTVTRTLTQANQTAYPDNLTICLTPGAHAAASAQLTAAWLAYTRKNNGADLAAHVDNEVYFQVVTDESNAAVQ